MCMNINIFVYLCLPCIGLCDIHFIMLAPMMRFQSLRKLVMQQSQLVWNFQKFQILTISLGYLRNRWAKRFVNNAFAHLQHQIYRFHFFSSNLNNNLIWWIQIDDLKWLCDETHTGYGARGKGHGAYFNWPLLIKWNKTNCKSHNIQNW